MGRVDATALIDLDWRGSGREGVLAEVAFKVYDNILQRAVFTKYYVLSHLRRGMQFGATGHGGHVYAFHLRKRTVKLNGPGHSARRGGVDRLCRQVYGGWPVAWLFGVFAAAAA